MVSAVDHFKAEIDILTVVGEEDVCEFSYVLGITAPVEIPDDAEKISNDVLHQMYGRYGMSENISLFIHNGHIYVYYESVDGTRIWQTVEIPYGWNVREDFEFMRYSWYNRDDDELPQNLQIIVSFDGGFLKLTFSSKWAHHEVEGDNFVCLMDASVFPFSSISDACHGQQTMHQYVYHDTMLFVSASQCNGKFVLTFEQIYFDENFEQCVCKVVLPLSEDVVIEYLEDLLQPQSLFFDYNGNPTEPKLVCVLEATISGERFLVELILYKESIQHFTDDGTEGLGVYSQMSERNFHSFDCVKRSRSNLVGILCFHNSDELDAARLLDIFPVHKMS
jgi:hypothetical protein